MVTQRTGSVASITIAYNSREVLPRQLDALLRQTRKLDEIIVVDNASTDDTSSLLVERYPAVRVLRLSENLGAGGAWVAGLRYAALERKHDWVWTFDDDSVPSDDALEALLSAFDTFAATSERIGMLACSLLHKETGARYRPFLWRNGRFEQISEETECSVYFADLVFTSGCLVRREVVESVGLPREDFFMDFIDCEYCLRARHQGYKIGVVPSSVLNHKLGNARWVRLPGYTRLRAEYPAWREYYMARNITYAMWWLYPSWQSKRFVLGFLAKRALGFILFGSGKLPRLQKMAQGFLDGRGANLGIRFRPS